MTAPDPNLAVVRALSGATTDDATDDVITALLLEQNAAPKLVAADVLELMATRLLTVDSDQIKVDGSKQAATLMARAAALRAQFYEHGGDFFFDTTPLGPDDYLHLGLGYTDYQWGYSGDEVI